MCTPFHPSLSQLFDHTQIMSELSCGGAHHSMLGNFAGTKCSSSDAATDAGVLRLAVQRIAVACKRQAVEEQALRMR